MFGSKKTKRNFIIAFIIALILHIIILYVFFSYKPEYDFNFPSLDNQELIMLPIIQDPPTPIDPLSTDEPLPPDEPLAPIQLTPQPQPKPLYNPHSTKDAEVMDGESITDSRQSQLGLEPYKPAAQNPSDGPQDDFLEQSEAVEPEFFDEEIDEEEISEEDVPEQENLEDDERENDEIQEKTEEIGQEDTEFVQSEEEAEEKDGYQAKEEILTEKDPNALRPIISQRSREKSRAQLANFAQGFSRQYQKVQDKKRKQNTGAARVQQQQTELQTMSYRQKVDQAIKEAAYYAKEIYSEIDIHHQIKTIITIDRGGRVTNIIFAKKTASVTVNNFMENIIRNAKFPPLPQHLNLQSWSHVWEPMIQVKKGKNSLRYQYS